MRIDSLGPLEDWGGFIDLDAVNDPLMDLDELSVTTEQRKAFRCAPNPASQKTRIVLEEHPSHIQSDPIAWRLVNPQGQVVLEGSGSEVPLHNVAAGMHLLTGTLEGSAFSVPLLVVSGR